MEQKTVMTLEFARGEEMIASEIMALVAAARSSAVCNTRSISLAEMQGESDKFVNAVRQTTAARPAREERANEDARNEDAQDEGAAEAYTEAVLRDLPVKKLTEILSKDFGVNPDDYDGKNTNKKLRDLILDAQDGVLEAPDGGDDTQGGGDDDARNDDARGDNTSSNTDVTHDDIRDLMADVITADEANRPKVIKELSALGVKSVGAIDNNDLAGFFAFLQTLKNS